MMCVRNLNSMYSIKEKLQDAFWNKDGSMKQEVIDTFDRVMAEREQNESDYYTNHFHHDKEIVMEYLKTHDSIDSDIEDYNKDIGCYDLYAFCNYLYIHTDIDIPIPQSEEYNFTAGLRINEGLLIELVMGQGSFYRVSIYEVDLGAGI